MLIGLGVALERLLWGLLGLTLGPNGSASGASDEVVLTLAAPAEGRAIIPNGTFQMGSSYEEIELAVALCRAEPGGACDPQERRCPCQELEFAYEFPAHAVTLTSYAIDRLEVSVGDYGRCVEVGPCHATPLAAGGKRFDDPALPVTMVTWSDANTYCAFRGGRLPTEAEWERAARGAAGRRFPWGNQFDPYLVNGGRFGLDMFEDKDGFIELAPPGAFRDGASSEGVMDLSGNVEEWVADWFGEYPESGQIDPAGPDTGDDKLIRGGSFAAGRPWLRSTTRAHDSPSARRWFRGFRCAYDVEPRR